MVLKSKLKKVKSKEFYVDNKKFFNEMISFKKLIKEHESKNLKLPVVSEYIAECFLNIAKKLSNRPNFINYQYKEDMISDAVENCLQYMHNFDPEKSNNPFAYFTQIINQAFIRKIQKEKKQLYIKFKMTENAFLHDEPHNKKYINDESDEHMRTYIQNFEDNIRLKKENKNKP